mmetsp:Transcript_34107/g.30878  ORF Transcript_34107/g.30878 Transcript_34107/m.30878 type:complete len:129 (+) Transcript_34107:666-1052(+)
MSQQNSKNELECFEEARIEFEKYAQSANLINFNQSPFYAGLISELAIAYKNNNNMKMAKDLANQSLKLRDRIFAKQNPNEKNYAKALSNLKIAEIYVAEHQYSQAHPYSDKGVQKSSHYGKVNQLVSA